MSEPISVIELNQVYKDQTIQLKSPQRQRIRNIAYTAVFGTMWGASELFLGSILHVTQIPIASHVLQSIGVIISFTGAFFIDSTFALTRIGLVASFWKMFSFGGGNQLPVAIAITIQSFIADLVIMVFRKNAVGYPLAAGFGFMWVPINFPLYGLILNGINPVDYIRELTDALNHDRFTLLVINGWFKIGLQEIILLVFVVHFIIGLVIGYLTYLNLTNIRRRMGNI